MITLQKWVKDFGGAEKVAKKMKMSGHGVRLWLRRERSPRPAYAFKLIKLSKGELTYDSIIKSTTLRSR